LPGFTLVELLVVISIAAILASLAVPSLRATMQNNQLDTVSNQLVAALATARSEAVRVPDAQICIFNPLNAASWASGWTAVTEATASPPCPLAPGTSGTTILQAPSAVPGQVSVVATATGPIGFDPMGRLVVGVANPPPTVIFVICADPSQPAVNQSRAVIVSPSGRASVAHVSKSGASQGLPIDDTGNAINSCSNP
jgi:type IV fimbrial biogenesis protein FimT